MSNTDNKMIDDNVNMVKDEPKKKNDYNIIHNESIMCIFSNYMQFHKDSVGFIRQLVFMSCVAWKIIGGLALSVSANNNKFVII